MTFLLKQILNWIQAIRFNEPSLRPKYYTTIEDENNEGR